MMQALLTAMLSGLFAGMVSFTLAERRDRLALKLSKIEDLIKAYSNWVGAILEQYQNCFPYALDGPLPDGFEDKLKELDNKRDVYHANARALLYLYAENGRDLEALINDAHRPLITAWGDLSLAYLKKEPRRMEMARRCADLRIAVVNAQRAGLDRIAEQGKQIADRPYLLPRPRLR